MRLTSADFSALLRTNFTYLNNLPNFGIDFLNEDHDWYLLAFLREQQRTGFSFEITFAALNAIVGALAEDSYFRSPIDNKIGFLNQNHHILGESGKDCFPVYRNKQLSFVTLRGRDDERNIEKLWSD
mgnify:CR=1 FL=1